MRRHLASLGALLGASLTTPALAPEVSGTLGRVDVQLPAQTARLDVPPAPKLGDRVVAHLRTIMPDTWLSFTRAYADDTRALDAWDARTRRIAWWLVGAVAVLSALVSFAVGRTLATAVRGAYASVYLAVVPPLLAALTWLFLLPRGFAWPTRPGKRAAAEWRVLLAVLLYVGALRYSTTAFAALEAKYGRAGAMPTNVLPADASASYLGTAAVVQVSLTMLLVIGALQFGIVLSDWNATRRRRRFARLLAVQDLQQASTVAVARAQPETVLPAADAVPVLASAARHVEHLFADSVRGVDDPIAHGVREFGYTVGDSIRAMGVPLLTHSPAARGALAEQIDLWTAAVLASAWDRVIDPEVARRPTRLWKRRLEELGMRLRWVAFGVTIAGVGILLWTVGRSPHTTLLQVAPLVGSLLGPLVAFAVGLELFKRRDQ